MNYQRINNITGWAVFAVAAFTYLSTIEPTASFWDCGEYISTAYKLEVGHPPGAPLFNLIGKFFSLFASDKAHIAQMVNSMSAMMSAFTILFLFWTITALALKVAKKSGELNQSKILTIIGSGLVGALAYTFSDSFWFSAVEGEVYASSSFFTAIVFWAILKWERVADEKYSERWLVLIAYLMGLSVGIHLLNLLAIPAIVFVYYFKKHETTRKGLIITFITSIFLLGFVQAGIIPGIASWAAKFELFFVNTVGLPFNSGSIIYFLVIIGAIIWGLKYTTKNNKAFANTMILCFTMLLIGYSSFITLIIRSQANPPMDENNPENAINLLSYLNREQYGDWPILYGQYYNAPLDPAKPYKDGNPVYTKSVEKGEYVISDERKNSIPNYDDNFKTIFPRMHSAQNNHVIGYKDWADIKGKPTKVVNNKGETETLMKPTFGENLKFFFKYQIGHMYGRYFMWNFVGRQNDIQGNGSILKGNWISGISALDAPRLGPQSNLPKSMKENKGMNKFYFLPLILGLIGIFFHFKQDKRDAAVVTLLFVLTGIAIIVYLNNTPYQPRERDYGYVGSFYAFAIWIGFGVYAIQDYLSRKLSATSGAAIATVVGLLAAPVLMAKGGWNDHDRSKRYTARDFAFDYLISCAPNAILFTNGDNDTFPLWYAQEVEGIRTDVRVVNLSLSNTDWYIEQMRRAAYESEGIPLTIQEPQYRQGTRDYVPFYNNPQLGIDSTKYYDIHELIKFLASDESANKVQTQGGSELSYLPTNKIWIPVDSAAAVNNGTVSKKDAGRILKGIPWKIKNSYLMKNDLMVFDIIATNNWKRPVYFAITVGDDSYLNLEDYFQLEGMTYRLVPLRNNSFDGQIGKVNTDIMYKNMMETFKWGGMENGNVYMDENNLRMTMNFRNNFARLADELVNEGQKDKALKALDKAMQVMPRSIVPYNFFMLPIANSYFRAGGNEKGAAIIKELAAIYEEDLNYYFGLKGELKKNVDSDIQQAMSVMQKLVYIAKSSNQTELVKDIEGRFNKLQSRYTGS